MIKLIAFDLDGTIGDTIPLCLKAFKEAVASYTDHELSENEIVQTFGLNEEGMIKQVVAEENWEKALNDFYVIYEKNACLMSKSFRGYILEMRFLILMHVMPLEYNACLRHGLHRLFVNN